MVWIQLETKIFALVYLEYEQNTRFLLVENESVSRNIFCAKVKGFIKSASFSSEWTELNAVTALLNTKPRWLAGCPPELTSLHFIWLTPSRFPERLVYWYLLRVLISWHGRWDIAGGGWWLRSFIDIKHSCKCLMSMFSSISRSELVGALGQGDRSKGKWSNEVAVESTTFPSAQGLEDINVGTVRIRRAWV